jgi:hypothetical protein
MDAIIASYTSKALIDILDSGFQIKLIHSSIDGGLVDDTKKLLAVNTKGNIESWFSIFVHEYCHFLQWKEKKFTGKKWDDTFGRLYAWINGKEEILKKERVLLSRRAKRVELDCERRTVAEIRKHKLPIDVDRYIQKANAYIFSYGFLAEGEKDLYSRGMFDSSLIYNLMPKHFLTRYDRMPRRYREMIIKLSNGKEKG